MVASGKSFESSPAMNADRINAKNGWIRSLTMETTMKTTQIARIPSGQYETESAACAKSE